MTIDDFEARMRRRARVGAVFRVVVAIFALVSLAGTAAVRFSRALGSVERATADERAEVQVDVSPDGTIRIAGSIVDDATLRRALEGAARRDPRVRVAIHARDDRDPRALRVVALAMTSGLMQTFVVADPDVR